MSLKRFKAIIKNLAFQVLLAIIAGVCLGHFYPALGVKMEIIGNGFISIIKVFIAPIIFLTITLGIAGIGDVKKVGRIGAKSLLYFEIVTTFALLLGILMAHIIEPGKIDMSMLSAKDATKYIKQADVPFDWLQFLLSNLTLQVLIVGLIFGVVLTFVKRKAKMMSALKFSSDLVFKALKLVMYLAPLGAFGGIAYAVGKFGLASLVPLGKLMLTMYITMALFIFLILGSILRFYKLSIWKFLKNIKEEILLVLATSSSEPAMPGLMLKLEGMGCSKPVVGLVVPTGYSFNLDGTSIYLSMAVLFIAQLYNVPLSVGEMVSVLGILMLTSKGAAGVTGSGFVVLASTLTAIHTIPVEGLAFLLGVDKFMSEARAITNIIGNGVATIVIAKSEKDKVVLD
ncbi:MAG: cation:dicarboxylase symporter family transporter [Bacteroidetes bacterium]|nr:cation:dicarboxylase symporter family transporter [Bacteroidota bacterium]